jgi:hypothetical protein
MWITCENARRANYFTQVNRLRGIHGTRLAESRDGMPPSLPVKVRIFVAVAPEKKPRGEDIGSARRRPAGIGSRWTG